MNTRRTMVAVAGALLGLSSMAAFASAGLGGMRAENYSSLLNWTAPPNRFYLDSRDSRQVFHFKSNREIRICDEVSTRSVGLDVSQAGRTTKVMPGQCDALNTKQVSVEPAGRLPAGMTLTGTIETVKPSKKSSG